MVRGCCAGCGASVLIVQPAQANAQAKAAKAALESRLALSNSLSLRLGLNILILRCCFSTDHKTAFSVDLCKIGQVNKGLKRGFLIYHQVLISTIVI